MSYVTILAGLKPAFRALAAQDKYLLLYFAAFL